MKLARTISSTQMCLKRLPTMYHSKQIIRSNILLGNLFQTKYCRLLSQNVADHLGDIYGVELQSLCLKA